MCRKRNNKSDDNSKHLDRLWAKHKLKNMNAGCCPTSK